MANTLQTVVLPEPEPPQIKMFSRSKFKSSMLCKSKLSFRVNLHSERMESKILKKLKQLYNILLLPYKNPYFYIFMINTLLQYSLNTIRYQLHPRNFLHQRSVLHHLHVFLSYSSNSHRKKHIHIQEKFLQCSFLRY